MDPHWTGVIDPAATFLTFGDTLSPQPLGRQPEEPAQAMRKATHIGVAAGSPREVTEFAAAVDGKIAEIALRLGSEKSWRLVRADPPRRH